MIKDAVVLLAILANEMIVWSSVLKQKLMNFKSILLWHSYNKVFSVSNPCHALLIA